MDQPNPAAGQFWTGAIRGPQVTSSCKCPLCFSVGSRSTVVDNVAQKAGNYFSICHVKVSR